MQQQAERLLTQPSVISVEPVGFERLLGVIRTALPEDTQQELSSVKGKNSRWLSSSKIMMCQGVFVTSLAPSTPCFSHCFVAGSTLPTVPLYQCAYGE
jgi:hypothetical protein